MPRKSTASMASNADDAGPPPPPKDGVNVEDLALPRTMVQRLAKGVLPPNTQIQKDALLAMSKGATVFVNYLTSSSWENTIRGGKKTINPKDVMDAVKDLEFERFLPRLEAELQKYNAIQCDKRNSYRKKVREAAKAKTNPDSSDPAEPSFVSTNGHREPGDDSPPAAKKARRSSGAATGSEGDDTDGDMGEQADDDQPDQEHEDDDVEDDEEVEEKGGEEQLTEDPLEIREDDDMGDDGSDSDESD